MGYQFDVVSLFPGMFSAILDYGVTGRAVKTGRVEFRSWNPRDFTEGKHKKVDDRSYGGGPGMVMMFGPMRTAIAKAREAQPDAGVIYLSPQGRRLEQNGVQELTHRGGIILVAGRYEGIDQRLLEAEIDEEWSVGDYVLSGGELAAMVLIDSICRILPGVLGHEDSACEDSFVDGLLDYPHYTRPKCIDGHNVPDILLSGDHERIKSWRLKQALGKTWCLRPDLIKASALDNEKKQLLREYLLENGQSLKI